MGVSTSGEALLVEPEHPHISFPAAHVLQALSCFDGFEGGLGNLDMSRKAISSDRSKHVYDIGQVNRQFISAKTMRNCEISGTFNWVVFGEG